MARLDLNVLSWKRLNLGEGFFVLFVTIIIFCVKGIFYTIFCKIYFQHTFLYIVHVSVSSCTGFLSRSLWFDLVMFACWVVTVPKADIYYWNISNLVLVTPYVRYSCHDVLVVIRNFLCIQFQTKYHGLTILVSNLCYLYLTIDGATCSIL